MISSEPEPHLTRRKRMMRERPEVKSLFGIARFPKYIAVMTVCFQLFTASIAASFSTLLFVLLAWMVGGTCNHSLTLAIHELAHDVWFNQSIYNRFFSLFVNIPIIIPMAISFRKYHLEHHRYQGTELRDVDVPTESEVMLFKGWFGKISWLILQPLFYGIRPFIINPKPITKLEVVNIYIQGLVIALMWRLWGLSAILYLLLSTFLGLGLHPLSGHFISEHFISLTNNTISPHRVDDSELHVNETFSYHGILNSLTYNVGHHVAHHDFPMIPGSRLPQVENLYPEYYNHLPVIPSWTGAIWKFIFDCNITLEDRVIRKGKVPQ